MTEFVSLQLSREELKDLHAALLERAILEDTLRRERGQESIEHRSLLEKIEMLLGDSDESLESLDCAIEDELWEYAWFAFTDEWAHYRAHQDAEQENAHAAGSADRSLADARAHKLYRKRFDEYIAEISMMDDAPTRTIRSPAQQSGSHSSSA